MIGVDKIIDRINEVFESLLWTDNDYKTYGRVFRNLRNEGEVPEFYVGDNEYIDTLLDDRLDAVSFVDVRANESPFQSADIWICFAVNLEELYPDYDGRATEFAHRDVYNALVRADNTPENLVRGYEAFQEYGFSDQNRYDMAPYYLFRFETKIEYSLCN